MANEIKIPISARIYNASVGGHVAGAKDIYDDDLELEQSEINKMVEDNLVTVSLSATKVSALVIGNQGSVKLTASSRIRMDSIKIKKGEEVIAEITNATSLTYTDNTVANYGITNYTAEFKKGGMTKTASVNAGAIYYGWGYAPFPASSKFIVQGGVGGTYEIVIPSDTPSAPHVWFMVPKEWSISKATKSDFSYPLESPVIVTQEGVDYKAYASTNTYDAGTETVVLS